MLSDLSAKDAGRWAVTGGLLVAAFAFGAAGVARAQGVGTPPAAVNQQQPPAADDEGAEDAAGEVAAVAPVYKDYKGVRIGMSAEEAREKLGNKKADGKTEDFFQPKDGEMVTLYYDKAGKVRAITAIFTGQNAPPDTAVLGEAVAPDANGRIYKLVRYPKEGYWVAYSRSAGDSPVVTVTMQRTRQSAAQTAKQE